MNDFSLLTWSYLANLVCCTFASSHQYSFGNLLYWVENLLLLPWSYSLMLVSNTDIWLYHHTPHISLIFYLQHKYLKQLSLWLFFLDLLVCVMNSLLFVDMSCYCWKLWYWSRYLGLQAWKKPYLLRRHNIMEFVLLVVNVLFILIGVIYFGTKFDESAMNAMILVLVSVSTVYILFMVLLDLKAHIKVIRTKRDSDEERANSGISLSKLN